MSQFPKATTEKLEPLSLESPLENPVEIITIPSKRSSHAKKITGRREDFCERDVSNGHGIFSFTGKTSKALFYPNENPKGVMI